MRTKKPDPKETRDPPDQFGNGPEEVERGWVSRFKDI